MLYSIPKTAGTIDKRRENSKRRGVSFCCRVDGGIRGPDEGIIREVGRWFGWRGERVLVFAIDVIY